MYPRSMTLGVCSCLMGEELSGWELHPVSMQLALPCPRVDGRLKISVGVDVTRSATARRNFGFV